MTQNEIYTNLHRKNKNNIHTHTHSRGRGHLFGILWNLLYVFAPHQSPHIMIVYCLFNDNSNLNICIVCDQWLFAALSTQYNEHIVFTKTEPKWDESINMFIDKAYLDARVRVCDAPTSAVYTVKWVFRPLIGLRFGCKHQTILYAPCTACAHYRLSILLYR